MCMQIISTILKVSHVWRQRQQRHQRQRHTNILWLGLFSTQKINKYKHRLTLAHDTRAPIKREWELIHLPEVTAYGFAHSAKINKLNVSCGCWLVKILWLGMAWHKQRFGPVDWPRREKKVHWRHCVWCARVRLYGQHKKFWLCIGYTAYHRSLCAFHSKTL